ncbi:peptidoglycan recognition family protein [Variovorax sp. J22P271]|uniref:peptidoglycan recognition protein family protein n=1 Tax=Variovorax davisae TaxID=3053515 RepID=UPI002577C2F8|nr:peptidoglycan recognition family protein [Variovorax sp. J22P271]MDM0032871.1 peptidoglycan recognition family protein [Variovorax sp. J22P271]
MSLYIDRVGIVDAERIKVKIFPLIERGTLGAVNGIVVHQTGGSTAMSSFNSYSKMDRNGGAPNGAHFLIEKDGQIYQTASLFRVTNHVGFLQSRCVITQKCTPTELKRSMALERIKGNNAKARAVHSNEERKKWPERYPSNADAIGIELVGEAQGKEGKEVFLPVTAQQTSSLQWLIRELVETFNVSMQEVYRHPSIGRKNESEARTATW